MTDPGQYRALVDQLTKRLAKTERRLQALERSPQRLARSSVDVGDGLHLNMPTAVWDASNAPLRLAQALQAVVTAGDITDGQVVVFFTDAAPAGADLPTPAVGDYWSHTVSWTLSRYTGATWQALADQTPAVAFAAANQAAAASDRFIRTYWAPTEPVGAAFGDLWFRTDTADAPHRWDATGWLPLILQESRSDNYVPGTDGYGLHADGDAQFKDVNVVGELGAGQVNAAAMSLAGNDIVGWINTQPRGIVAYALRGSSGATGAGPVTNTLARLFQFAPGEVQNGRLYEVNLHGHIQGSAAGDAFDLRVTYTLDGSEPTTTSPVMPGSLYRFNIPTVVSEGFDYSFPFAPTADSLLRMAFCMQRVTGTGTGTVFLADANRSFQWTLEDKGLSAGALASDRLAQMLKADGSGADNAPIATRTSQWVATWSETYKSQPIGGPAEDVMYGAEYLDPTSADRLVMWQGYRDSSKAYSDRSLCGFNYSNIQSTLATAQQILSCSLIFRTRYRTNVYGLDVLPSVHSYVSKPEYFDVFGNSNIENAITPAKINTVPGGVYKISLGAAVGTDFKNGVWRGLGICGPLSRDNQYRGYIYGLDPVHPDDCPKLEIVWKG